MENEPPIDFTKARYQKLIRVKRELLERVREIDGELARIGRVWPNYQDPLRPLDSFSSRPLGLISQRDTPPPDHP